jgi:hypothetical protein
VNLAHHALRRLPRREHPVPELEVVALLALLGDRRHIGQQRMTARARDAVGFHAAGLDVGHARERREK